MAATLGMHGATLPMGGDLVRDLPWDLTRLGPDIHLRTVHLPIGTVLQPGLPLTIRNAAHATIATKTAAPLGSPHREGRFLASP